MRFQRFLVTLLALAISFDSLGRAGAAVSPDPVSSLSVAIPTLRTQALAGSLCEAHLPFLTAAAAWTQRAMYSLRPYVAPLGAGATLAGLIAWATSQSPVHNRPSVLAITLLTMLGPVFPLMANLLKNHFHHRKSRAAVYQAVAMEATYKQRVKALVMALEDPFSQEDFHELNTAFETMCGLYANPDPRIDKKALYDAVMIFEQQFPPSWRWEWIASLVEGYPKNTLIRPPLFHLLLPDYRRPVLPHFTLPELSAAYSEVAAALQDWSSKDFWRRQKCLDHLSAAINQLRGSLGKVQQSHKASLSEIESEIRLLERWRASLIGDMHPYTTGYAVGSSLEQRKNQLFLDVYAAAWFPAFLSDEYNQPENATWLQNFIGPDAIAWLTRTKEADADSDLRLTIQSLLFPLFVDRPLPETSRAPKPPAAPDVLEPALALDIAAMLDNAQYRLPQLCDQLSNSAKGLDRQILADRFIEIGKEYTSIRASFVPFFAQAYRGNSDSEKVILPANSAALLTAWIFKFDRVVQQLIMAGGRPETDPPLRQASVYGHGLAWLVKMKARDTTTFEPFPLEALADLNQWPWIKPLLPTMNFAFSARGMRPRVDLSMLRFALSLVLLQFLRGMAKGMAPLKNTPITITVHPASIPDKLQLRVQRTGGFDSDTIAPNLAVARVVIEKMGGILTYQLPGLHSAVKDQTFSCTILIPASPPSLPQGTSRTSVNAMALARVPTNPESEFDPERPQDPGNPLNEWGVNQVVSVTGNSQENSSAPPKGPEAWRQVLKAAGWEERAPGWSSWMGNRSILLSPASHPAHGIFAVTSSREMGSFSVHWRKPSGTPQTGKVMSSDPVAKLVWHSLTATLELLKRTTKAIPSNFSRNRCSYLIPGCVS